jgi:hypothetical protein
MRGFGVMGHHPGRVSLKPTGPPRVGRADTGAGCGRRPHPGTRRRRADPTPTQPAPEWSLAGTPRRHPARQRRPSGSGGRGAPASRCCRASRPGWRSAHRSVPPPAGGARSPRPRSCVAPAAREPAAAIEAGRLLRQSRLARQPSPVRERNQSRPPGAVTHTIRREATTWAAPVTRTARTARTLDSQRYGTIDPVHGGPRA